MKRASASRLLSEGVWVLSIAAGLVALRANLACAGANETMAKQGAVLISQVKGGGVRALDSLIVAQVGGEGWRAGEAAVHFSAIRISLCCGSVI